MRCKLAWPLLLPCADLELLGRSTAYEKLKVKWANDPELHQTDRYIEEAHRVGSFLSLFGVAPRRRCR